VIDVSSPEVLERDFYAWLNVGGAYLGCNSDSILIPISIQGSDHEQAMRRGHAPCTFSSPHPYSQFLLGDCMLGVAAGSYASSTASPTSSSAATTIQEWSSTSPHESVSSLVGISSIHPSSVTAASLLFASPMIPQQPPSGLFGPSHQSPSQFLPAGDLLRGDGGQMGMGKPRVKRKRTVDKGRGTNLYGRPYCPGRPLSMEERAQIIHLFHAGMKVNAISKQLCISHGCVSKIITRYGSEYTLMIGISKGSEIKVPGDWTPPAVLALGVSAQEETNDADGESGGRVTH